jgi:hypothetical protein
MAQGKREHVTCLTPKGMPLRKRDLGQMKRHDILE